jgi:hypothetical protein
MPGEHPLGIGKIKSVLDSVCLSLGFIPDEVHGSNYIDKYLLFQDKNGVFNTRRSSRHSHRSSPYSHAAPDTDNAAGKHGAG